MSCSFLTHILLVLFCPCSSSSWIIQGVPVCSLPFHTPLLLFSFIKLTYPGRNFPFPHLARKTLKLQMWSYSSLLYVVSGGSNSGCHTFISSILPTEPSPQSQYPCFSLLIYHPVFPAECLIFSGPPLLESSRFPSGCPQQDCRGGWLDHRLGY